MPSTRHAQANPGVVPIADLGLGGQNWAELVFQGFPSGTVQPVQFIPNPEVQFFTPYKLPVSYEGIDSQVYMYSTGNI